MPKPRCSGFKWSIRVWSSQRLPEVRCCSPAIQLRAVVFPQPEGPSKATNSPLATVREMPLRALNEPNEHRTSSRRSSSKLRAAAVMTPPALSLIDLRTNPPDRPPWSLLRCFCAADQAIPLVEHRDQCRRVQRRINGIVGDQTGIFGPSEGFEGVLALSRRHSDRDAADCRTGIHVAIIKHVGLLRGLKHEGQKLDQDLDLLRRDAFRKSRHSCHRRPNGSRPGRQSCLLRG